MEPSRRTAVCLLLAPVIPVNAAIMLLGPATDRPAVAIAGAIFGQVGLVFVWAALSDRQIRLRCAGVLATLAAVTLLFTCAPEFAHTWEKESPYFPTALAIQFTLLFAALWRLRHRGRRLTHRSDPAYAARIVRPREGLQFSLRALWVIMTLASLLMVGIPALHAWVHEGGTEVIVWHVFFAVFGVSATTVSLSTIWATQLGGRAWLRLPVPLLIALAGGMIIDYIFLGGPLEMMGAIYTVSRAATMGLWLWLAAAVGFRMVKISASEPRSPVAADDSRTRIPDSITLEPDSEESHLVLSPR